MNPFATMKFADLALAAKNLAETKSRVWDGRRFDAEATDNMIECDEGLERLLLAVIREMNERV